MDRKGVHDESSEDDEPLMARLRQKRSAVEHLDEGNHTGGSSLKRSRTGRRMKNYVLIGHHVDKRSMKLVGSLKEGDRYAVSHVMILAADETPKEAINDLLHPRSSNGAISFKKVSLDRHVFAAYLYANEASILSNVGTERMQTLLRDYLSDVKDQRILVGFLKEDARSRVCI